MLGSLLSLWSRLSRAAVSGGRYVKSGRRGEKGHGLIGVLPFLLCFCMVTPYHVFRRFTSRVRKEAGPGGPRPFLLRNGLISQFGFCIMLVVVCILTNKLRLKVNEFILF